jgi:hypothetical protein
VLVLVAGAASSAARQRGWRDQETFVSRLRADAPLSYRAHWIHAHQLVRKRDRAGAEREFQRALELFAGDPVLLWEMADRYAAMGRCAEALPLHRRSLGLRTRVLLDRQRYRRCLAEEVRR